MAWTAPRTWSTSEVVTAAMLNTHIRDNENWLNSFHGVRVYKSANQTVASGNFDVVNFNTESYDTDAFHDTATNNSRLTVPSGAGGYYAVTAQMVTDADGANHNAIGIGIRMNAAGASGGGTGLETLRQAGHSLLQAWIVPIVVPLAVGDYVEVFFNSFSEARDLQGGTVADTWFGMAYLGA